LLSCPILVPKVRLSQLGIRTNSPNERDDYRVSDFQSTREIKTLVTDFSNLNGTLGREAEKGLEGIRGKGSGSMTCIAMSDLCMHDFQAHVGDR